jgi:outer membrane protein OmpA-like peptidoglycan-associated protein
VAPAVDQPTVQRYNGDPKSDPQRYEKLHKSLFVHAAVKGSSVQLLPWTAGTADLIKRQFKNAIIDLVKKRPRKAVGGIKRLTTKPLAEADMIRADKVLRSVFPQIGTKKSEKELRSKTIVFQPDFGPGKGPAPDLLVNWIGDRLPKTTDIKKYRIATTSTPYRQLVNDLATDKGIFPIDDILKTISAMISGQTVSIGHYEWLMAKYRKELQNKSWAWLFNRLLSRSAAFEGEGTVYVSASISAVKRVGAIFHELTHLYAHPDYRRWVTTTTSYRDFNEGFAEHLARLAMPAKSRQIRAAAKTKHRSKEAALIRTKILPYISLDDLARAYFQGQVWRIEAKSAVAQELFKKQVGLDPKAPRPDEVAQSRSAKGIVQVVEPDRHYRFMNIGVSKTRPKQEHEAALKEIVDRLVKKDPAIRLRFVGHASSTGPKAYNRRLSRRRSAAFYRLARKLGAPSGQLLDAGRPPHSGETLPTAGNDTVHGRALNRRVELYITRQVGGS